MNTSQEFLIKNQAEQKVNRPRGEMDWWIEKFKQSLANIAWREWGSLYGGLRNLIAVSTRREWGERGAKTTNSAVMFIKWQTIIKHSRDKTYKGNELTKFSGQQACMVYNGSTRGTQVCAAALLWPQWIRILAGQRFREPGRCWAYPSMAGAVIGWQSLERRQFAGRGGYPCIRQQRRHPGLM